MWDVGKGILRGALSRRVHGIDTEASYIRIAKDKIHDKDYTAEVGDFRQMTREFDTVLSVNTVEHIADEVGPSRRPRVDRQVQRASVRVLTKEDGMKTVVALALAASIATASVSRAEAHWWWPLLAGTAIGVVGAWAYHHYDGCGPYGCGPRYGYYGPPRRVYYGPPRYYSYYGPPRGYYGY